MTDNTDTLPGELCRIQTSDAGAIVATIGEFMGRRVVDVRKYYAVEGAGLKPTRKGLAIEVDRLPALAALVGAALDAARAQGLLPTDGSAA
jgi:hypothetical protein